jgi:hypothetical protein
MIVRRRSPLTGEINDLDLPITVQQIRAYEAGALIQNAFPNLTPDQREFLKTGTYPGEWDVYFAKVKDA